MKINILSNAPWASTGYGCQTKVLAPRLKAAGHDVSITAYYGLEGGALNWNGIPVFPRAFHVYGADIAGAHALNVSADILLSNMDAWVCEPKNWPANRWVAWFPVDHDPIPPAVSQKISQAYYRIAVTRFGQEAAKAAGMDCDYAPYSIDTNTFHPVDRTEAREKARLPKDAFIVGMVAMNKGNPSRKAFTQQIEAFAIFKQKHPDAILYLHTAKCEHGENGGVNLPEFCAFWGLRENVDVFFPNAYDYFIGYPDEQMNYLYNAFDVHMLVTMGEGFGLPIIEAQAAGCPVIIGDWIGAAELLFSGWKVSKREAERVWTGMASYQYNPAVHAIADRLEAAYRKCDNQIYRDKARAGAIIYDADRVYTEYWIPCLERISEKIKAEPPADMFALNANLESIRE